MESNPQNCSYSTNIIELPDVLIVEPNFLEVLDSIHVAYITFSNTF